MKTAIHTCLFFLGIDSPETQVTASELDCLSHYVRESEVAVEIGCYQGRTTGELARNTKGQVYTIDPFIRGRLGIGYGELIAKTHCRRLGLKNVEFLRGYSHDIAPNFSKPIDFIFIDADHTYEAMKRDWQDWFPKVKKGGIIALHDCRRAPNSPDYLGSMKFYESDVRRVPEVHEIATVDSLAVLRVRQ